MFDFKKYNKDFKKLGELPHNSMCGGDTSLSVKALRNETLVLKKWQREIPLDKREIDFLFEFVESVYGPHPISQEGQNVTN